LEIIKNHIKQYSSFLLWLVSDLYVKYRWRLTWVIISTFVGLSMQTGAVYLCYRYAKALESNASFLWLEFEVFPRTSFVMLLAVASIVMIMTIVAAILVMKGRMVGLQLARDYTDYCSARIFVLISSVSVIPNIDDVVTVDPKFIFTISSKDSLYAGMVVRILSFSLISIGTALVAGCSLFIIDASLTLIVILVLMLTAILFYKKSIKGAAIRILLGKLGRGKSEESKILSDRVCFGSVPLTYSNIGMNEIYKRGATSKFSKAYVNQRLVLEESNLLAQIVIGTSIFLIILVQGSSTLELESNWSSLLIYLVAFSLFSTSFAKTAKMFTSINRFYPTVKGYSKFVKAISNQLELEKFNTDKDNIQASLFIDINDESIELKKGDLIAYVSPSSINNYQSSNLIKELYFTFKDLKKKYYKKPWLVSLKYSLVKTSVREALSLSESLNISDIKSDILGLNAEEKFDGFPSDLDKVLNMKDIDKVNLKSLVLLLLVSGKHHDNDIVIIDETGLRMFSEDVRENIFQYLSGKIVMISYSANSIDCLGEHGESIALFSNDERIVGYVDLIEPDKNKINNYLQEIKLNTNSNDARNTLLDEDLDEDF
jgi:hypothetical protein